MKTNVLEIKDRVQRFLAEMVGTVQIDRDGDFTFQHGSCQIFVRVREWNNENVTVNLLSPVNIDVPSTPELFHFIATNSNTYVFGHLSAQEAEDGITVVLSHTLLGDFLDHDELKWALFAIATTADQLDDEIKEKFGGRKFHEE